MNLVDPIDVLVLTAIGSEFAVARRLLASAADRRDRSVKPLLRCCIGNVQTSTIGVVQIGLGPQKAEQGTRLALERFKPAKAVLIGIAGGLDPTMRVGDVLAVHSVRSDRTNDESIPSPYFSSHLFKSGSLVTVARPAFTPEDKRRLFAASGAAAVDMESFAVASVCRELGVPLQIVRIVSDDAQTTVSREFFTLLDENGGLRIGRAVRLLLLKPSLWPKVMRAQRDARISAAAMEAALRAILEQPAASSRSSRPE